MVTNRKTDTKQNAKLTRKVWFSVGLAFLLAAPIFFQVVFGVNPITAGQYLLAQVGTAVGVGASVPSNPFNSLVQQFQEREQMLLEKEKELQQKDAALQEQTNKRQNTQNKLIIALLILVLLNFYLDYRRRNRETDAKL